jgi:hypothetical protein
MSRKLSVTTVLVAWLLCTVFCASAQADGGAVVASERVGPWQISVLVSPAAICVGPADVSLLVQDAASGQVVEGLAVTLEVAPENSPADSMHLEATRAAATNKLFYAAQCELPTAGRWTIRGTVSDSQHEAKVSALVDVAGPPPAWVELWPWMAWPALVIALFLLRERLAYAQQYRRSQRPAVARA